MRRYTNRFAALGMLRPGASGDGSVHPCTQLAVGSKMPVSPAAKTMSSGERMKANPLLTKAVQNAKLREHKGQLGL